MSLYVMKYGTQARKHSFPSNKLHEYLGLLSFSLQASYKDHTILIKLDKILLTDQLMSDRSHDRNVAKNPRPSVK